MGRVLQDGIDLQRDGVSALPPLCAHVYITSDDDWAEEHGPSPAFLNPSVGSAFTGKWVSVCSHVPAVSGPLENAFGLSEAFVNPIVSSHCCDPSDNPLLGLFV